MIAPNRHLFLRASLGAALALGAIVAAPARAAIDLNWTASYGGPGVNNDEYRDMGIGPDGSVFVTGMDALGASGDIVTVAFDPDGAQRWVASYNGPAGSQDVAQALAVDHVGDVYVVGLALTNTSSSDYVTIKYRGSDGVMLWSRLHDGDGSIDEARDVAVDAAGNVFVTGTAWVDGAGSDIDTVKYDADGNELWAVRYTGPGSEPFAGDEGVALIADANGDVFVTGSSKNAIDDYITIKYRGSDGAEIWQQRYDGIGLSDRPRAMAIDAAGDVYVTGISYQTLEGFATVRYRGTDGQQLWAAVDDPGGHDTVWSIEVSGDGVYIAASSDPDGDESNNNDDAYVARYRRADGVKAWGVRHGETGFGDYDVVHTVVPDGNGSVVAAGRTNSFGADSDLLVLRLDEATGDELEHLTWSGPPAGGMDTALTGALSPSGEVVLGGITSTVDFDRDYAVWSVGGAATGDVDGDGIVGLADLLSLLAAWGPCAGDCAADLDGDDLVGFLDLLILLGGWS